MLILNVHKLKNIVPQRKIYDRIAHQIHEKKQQEEIKIETNDDGLEEDDDFDEFEEGYQGRYQIEYKVLEKKLPENNLPYEDSEMEDASQYSHSVHERIKSVKGDNDNENKSAQTFEMGISTSNAYVREDKSDVQKQSENSQAPKKTYTIENSSVRSSSVGRDQKPFSQSSKQRNSYSKPVLSKAGSERKSMAHWIESEKEEFKKQLSIHGKDWKKISEIITNKTEKQIRNFYQNYKKKMKLEDLLPSKDKQETSKSIDGGASPLVKRKQSEKVGKDTNSKSGKKSGENYGTSSKKKTKKSEIEVSPSSKLKRARSYNKSASPYKNKRNKKRKIISSDNESEQSLSNVDEEESKNESSSSSSSSMSRGGKLNKRETKMKRKQSKGSAVKGNSTKYNI